MSDKTTIEWTDATWNPIRGCSRVSEGCRNCYAERQAARFNKAGQAYEGLAKLLFTGEGAETKYVGPRWTGEVRFIEEHLEDPLHWKSPKRIFVNSMSDLFHENVKDEWLDQIFAVMALCPRHAFQCLTKRPERMFEYLRRSTTELRGRVLGRAWDMLDHHPMDKYAFEKVMERPFPLPNVWLGVSCEDQKTADERIPLLLQTPAAMRWISAEPLLGPIDLRRHSHVGILLDWVVVGGESGPGARPMHPDWPCALRDQCQVSRVPFFFKQWGEWLPPLTDGAPGRNQLLNVSDDFVRIGKKAAGRLLDGREWNEFPHGTL